MAISQCLILLTVLYGLKKKEFPYHRDKKLAILDNKTVFHTQNLNAKLYVCNNRENIIYNS